MGKYQSFPGEPGASLSDQKLAAIRLPLDLTGKRVLDLGCNEGFFCLEAKRRGAKYVLGIDRNPKHIPAARQHAADLGLDIEFRHGDMRDLPEGPFDIVIFLSAIHYIPDPADLLSRIRRILSKRGRLILELGVVQGEGMSVGRALRGLDERMFPTVDLLKDVWLRGYSARLIGPSIAQSGDPVPRRVYHCRRQRTSVVMIHGEGNIGKSTLARSFGRVPIVSTDRLLRPARAKNATISPVQALFDEKMKENRSLAVIWRELRDNPDARSYCVSIVADAIRQCRGMGIVIVEGHILADIGVELENELGADFRCWSTARGAPGAVHEPEADEGPEAPEADIAEVVKVRRKA